MAAVDLRDVRMRGPGPSHARWDGYWRVPAAGRYKLVAQGAGPIVVTIDGEPAVTGQREGRLRGLLDLEAGWHALAVEYDMPEGPDVLRLRWAEAETPPREFAPGALFPDAPSDRALAWTRASLWLGRLARVAWAAGAVLLLVAGFRGGPRARRAAAIALPAAVVLYAAALRAEALVGRYAWAGPRWALEGARVVERWHPAALRWEPVEEITGGDPYHYAERARTMRGFYDPDAREPLFPAITRALLPAFGGRLLAVHAASALCSTLCVLAVYLLGTLAFSRAVGALAALLLAVERDVLWWSVEGFRDDAFMLFVVLSALALVRLAERPTAWRGALCGVAGAAACLTRLSSLSFLLPALALLLVGRGPEARSRRRAVGVAALVLLALVGPFLLSCALAYGDPFYAVNFHTKFYRSRSGMAFQDSMGWLDYLRRGSPLGAQLATGWRGLTSYPFGNKWRGFDEWVPGLGEALAVASLCGLVLFVRTPRGRLLLAVLVTSLLPYAFTWPIPGGAEWRFTMHAYAFYLVAAALALAQAASWIRGALRRGPPSRA